MTFIDHFTCITKISTIYLATTKPMHSYQVLVTLRRCQYIPETLMQKNNIGTIGS